MSTLEPKDGTEPNRVRLRRAPLTSWRERSSILQSDPPLEPADITNAVEPADCGAESLVKTRRRPLSRKFRMHHGRNSLAGEEEVDLWFRSQCGIAPPGCFELGLVDRTAELRHESLRKGYLPGEYLAAWADEYRPYCSVPTITDFRPGNCYT